MFKRLTGLWPVLVAGALVLGCSAAAQPLSGSPASSAVSAPATAPAGSGGAAGSAAAPSGDGKGCLAQAPKPDGSHKVTVRRVVDGDTIELQDGTKVRLVGINTPESVDPRRPVQAYGKEASAHAKELLEGKEILLKEGRTAKDQYGRTLAWLWMPDGRFINGMLVEDGYAQVYTFSDNPDYADLLLACQREARAANRGLWALPDYHDGEEAAKMDREPAAGGTSAAAGGTATAPVPASSTPAPAPAAPAPAPAAPGSGSVTITRAPGTVARNATATVGAKAPPGSHCTVTVTYKGGPSKAQGLEPKDADGGGAVSWSWKVGSSTTQGTWPVTVTCGGQSAETSITVQ